MTNKKIAVLLKYFKGELNPFDGAALEMALACGCKDITVLAMAPQSVQPALETITRLGVKAILLSDCAYAGSDTIVTSLVLAKALQKLNPDIVFCGRQSVDGDTSQVPPMLAQRLGWEIKSKVMEQSDGVFTLRSGERVTAQNKTIYTFERCKTLRFPSIFSKKGEVTVWDNSFLGIDTQLLGLQGSPTKVVRSYESTVGRRICNYITADKLPELIASACQKQRQNTVCETGEKLQTVYFVGDIQNIAQTVAHTAVQLSAENKTAEQLASEMHALGVNAVLWEDSEAYKTLAPKVAVLLNAGMCADCISFRVEGGKLIMTRPAQGGNITADIVCTSKIAFATVRTAKKGGADVIFSVGSGAAHQLEKIKALAAKYNAELCCSRMVTDSGQLPYAAQVGLTGKTVSPKVYVAIGISGAVQHTCSIAGAGTVIAVNCDKNARIFDYADYGIVDKIENL